MEKVLLGNHKFYKGNMHCHTNLSDGTLSPEEVKKLYKENGYSFVAFTDHDHINKHPYLDDEEFIAITSGEYQIKQFRELSTLKNVDMKVCHINFYAKEQENDYSFSYEPLFDKYSKGRKLNKSEDTPRVYTHEAISTLIKEGEKHGFFACYNHSRWSLENYSDYSGYEGLWGVEIYNNACIISGIYEYNICVAEDLLRGGKRVFLSCGDDNHNDKPDSFGAFVMADIKDFSYKGIIDALLSGNFYASQKPIIHKLSVDANKVKVECSDARQICYTTATRRSMAVLATDKPVNYAEFEINETDKYFKIDVVDFEGYRANTQAYFLDDLGVF